MAPEIVIVAALFVTPFGPSTLSAAEAVVGTQVPYCVKSSL